MKIREISIKNYLSFNERGLNQNGSIQLDDFNLFIGANNAGKSNLLKLVSFLRYILSAIRGVGSLRDFAVVFPGESKDWVYAQDSQRKRVFSFSLEIEKTDQTVLDIQAYDHSKRDAVSFLLDLKGSWPKVFKFGVVLEHRGETAFATITKVEIPNDHQAYRNTPVLFDTETRQLLALKPDVGRSEPVWKVIRYSRGMEDGWNTDYQVVNNAAILFLRKVEDKIFSSLAINIDAVRSIQTAGDNISETLATLKEGSSTQNALFSRVEEFINRLIFDDATRKAELRFPGSTGQKKITIAAGKNLVLPLNNYGSSVEQMIVLATRIVQNGPNKIILMEEPEAHFHPDLQRKFVRFLRENQEILGHQYLIATHSNIFIDEFMKMRGSVFYVYTYQDSTTGLKYSQVEPLDKDKLPALIKDLGVRPSDLFFANGLLIVEGPIDKRIYADWAKKVDKSFETAGVLVLDADGAGNIPKYLLSPVIQQTCFKTFGFCDKNAEKELRRKLKGIVPDENIIILDKGDIEDYYPRQLVVEFVAEQYRVRGEKAGKTPGEIKEGETVEKLDELLGKDKWKTRLADKVMAEMKPEEISKEIRDKLTKLYDSIC